MINVKDKGVWELSKTDRTQSMAVASDGLTCQARETREWHGCRANKGVEKSGKYYYEANISDEGLCRVGWSTVQVFFTLFFFIIMKKTFCVKNTLSSMMT